MKEFNCLKPKKISIESFYNVLICNHEIVSSKARSYDSFLRCTILFTLQKPLEWGEANEEMKLLRLTRTRVESDIFKDVEIQPLKYFHAGFIH